VTVVATPASLRRLELAHIVLAVVWGVGMSLVVVVNWSDPRIAAGALAVEVDGLIFIYLGTFAARVRVTPTHLLVCNPFVWYAVPRQLVRDVDVVSYWFVPRLVLDGGRRIRLVVLNRNLPGGMDYGPNRRQGQLIMRMIRETPAATGSPASNELSRRLRWSNLALAMFMAATAVGCVCLSLL
jgi:hypothetical protein